MLQGMMGMADTPSCLQAPAEQAAAPAAAMSGLDTLKQSAAGSPGRPVFNVTASAR